MIAVGRLSRAEHRQSGGVSPAGSPRWQFAHQMPVKRQSVTRDSSLCEGISTSAEVEQGLRALHLRWGVPSDIRSEQVQGGS